jgi:hypothetical protein
VETCTVTALDVITAFAAPNPSFSSQCSCFFRVWLLDELPRERITQHAQVLPRREYPARRLSRSTEMQSINEKDFECFANTGVNTPGTMFPYSDPVNISLLRTGKGLIKPILSTIDAGQPKQLLADCQCPFSVQCANATDTGSCNATP